MVINGEEMGNILENCKKETKRYVNTRQSEFSRIQLGQELLQYFCGVQENPIDPLTFEYQSTSQYQLPDGMSLEIGKNS